MTAIRILVVDDSVVIRKLLGETLALDPDLEQSLVESNDGLLRILQDQDLLLSRGQVFWGHLVQANSNDTLAPVVAGFGNGFLYNSSASDGTPRPAPARTT